jgi:hypothetical protein
MVVAPGGAVLSSRDSCRAVVSNRSRLREAQPLAWLPFVDMLYAISDGTLSEVTLFPPGHLISVSVRRPNLSRGIARYLRLDHIDFIRGDRCAAVCFCYAANRS